MSVEPRSATPLADGFAATECPRWREGELYFSDLHGHAVHAVTEAGEVRVVVETEGTPGGLGWLPDGTLLVVAQEARQLLRLDGDRLSVHADLSGSGESALNDMWVEPDGVAYVGEMGFDVHGFLRPQPGQEPVIPGPGRIFRIDPDGSVTVAAEGLMFPNGIVRCPRTGRLFVAESFGFAVSAFDIGEDGGLVPAGKVAALAFAPDGLAVDAEGGLWVADPAGHRAVLLSPEGEEADVVATGQQCLSMALGGTDGRTLFLCSTPETGAVEALALRGSRIDVARVATQAPS